MLVGCGSPKQTAYKTLAAVGLSVNSAADTYALARYQGIVSDKNWIKATEVHGRFLVGYRVAVLAASGDLSKYAPEELVKLELEVLNAFAQKN